MTPTSLTNESDILKAIAACPEGPVVLWHYKSPNDPQHKARRARIALTCQGLGHNIFMFNGAQWRLTCQSSESGSGFALLERIIERPNTLPVKHTSNRPDPREWWLEQLKERGLLMEAGKTPPTPPAQPRDFGLGLSQDE